MRIWAIICELIKEIRAALEDLRGPLIDRYDFERDDFLIFPW